MKLHAWVWMLLAIITGCGTTPQPNVVLVMTDDQGYGDVAAHGNTVIQTPAIDALHAESVRFTNFHVDPTCSPTRSALMTGRYSRRVGVWHTIMGRSLLAPEETTMAEVFSAAGYRTGMFGKWHLGDNYPLRPQDQGFDETLVMGGGAVHNIPGYWGNYCNDDTYYRDGVPEKFQGYCTDIWFDEAMNFIRANKEQPFFCYLPTNAPHGPWVVDDRYSMPYANNENVFNDNFYGMVVNFDENLGRMRTFLKDEGLEKNTIFIYMTDNGSAAGYRPGKGGFNAGMRGWKGSEYDGGHRVPFYMRWPAGGIDGGRDVDRLAAHFDVLPTLIDLCGLQSPNNVEFDGTSVTPLLRGKSLPERTLFVESQRVEYPEKWRKSSVMREQWRLVNGKELYEIRKDPGQENDVAAQHPDIVSELRTGYEQWYTDVSGRHDEYVRIGLGGTQNPTTLNSHDMHEEPRWLHEQVLQGVPANGFWAVNVETAGEYEISLKRWPDEVGLPITAALPDGKALPIVQAGLQLGAVSMSRGVMEGDVAASFTVELQAGPAKLVGWFGDKDGGKQSAYYVTVNKL
jgi:arylsulfatase A-like enzyme